MTQTRRDFLAFSAALAGTTTVLPFVANAAAHAGNMFKTPAGEIKIHPINHASIVMETPLGTIMVDPVGDPELYKSFQKPDLVLITHEHGDHYKEETLTALATGGTPIVANPAVAAKLPVDHQAQTSTLANGEFGAWESLKIEAIPAYNTTEERKKFHPQGRDNGYVLDIGGFRIYISGDTEDVPEMRALKNIDLAFVCMNLPFTMDAKAAASAVAEFAPKYVYPYHYRGRDGGTQDPQEFANLVGDASEVRLGDWYGG